MIATRLGLALQKNHLLVDENVQQKLIDYLDLLSKWNKTYNLTSITEPLEMVYLHIIDSLSIAPILHGNRCLDLGSGAGLPGIPLAIIEPQREWTLVDKNSKKTRFLKQAVAELNLSNVKIIRSRSEDFHSEECFDSIVSRAFGSLTTFVNASSHLICRNGRFIAMKGRNPSREITQLPENIVVQEVIALDIKGFDIVRHIVCLQKKEA